MLLLASALLKVRGDGKFLMPPPMEVIFELKPTLKGWSEVDQNLARHDGFC
jgi:hypothetical protein